MRITNDMLCTKDWGPYTCKYCGKTEEKGSKEQAVCSGRLCTNKARVDRRVAARLAKENIRLWNLQQKN